MFKISVNKQEIVERFDDIVGACDDVLSATWDTLRPVNLYPPESGVKWKLIQNFNSCQRKVDHLEISCVVSFPVSCNDKNQKDFQNSLSIEGCTKGGESVRETGNRRWLLCGDHKPASATICRLSLLQLITLVRNCRLKNKYCSINRDQH